MSTGPSHLTELNYPTHAGLEIHAETTRIPVHVGDLMRNIHRDRWNDHWAARQGGAHVS